jgi:hypothetical protein
MQIPLRLGPLIYASHRIHRSGVRWLCEPGQMCRANQAVAYFNLSLEYTGTGRGESSTFAEERELQVVCAPRVAGRVMFDPDAAPGGYLSVVSFNSWDPDSVLAHLEVEDSAGAAPGEAGQLRHLMLAGRRMSPLIDVHSGLLPGWHARRRGWWCEPGETPVTLLSLGICDAHGVIMGEQCGFLEAFQAETAPRQLIYIPDHPISPSTPVVFDQLERTPAQATAIAADLHEALSKSTTVPTADDWIFAGAMMATQDRSPIRETYDLFSGAGRTKGHPPDAVLLSLNAEQPTVLRHRKLGYHLQVLQHHQSAAGPAVRQWLAKAFESVERTTESIRADYQKLIGAIDKATGARVIILNRMSTSGDEDISTYAPFDAPLSGTLANIASKELNLMLHDVAENRNVAIVDVDAIAADIGGGEHLPDGVHQSQVLQKILRAEILRVLSDMGSAS